MNIHSSMKTVSLLFIISSFIIGVVTDDMETVPVMMGDSVTLHTDTVIQSQDVMLWKFGDEGDRIASINQEANKISLYNRTDGRFRDRLKLNNQTGDLTVTNIRSEHTGVYQLQIRRETITTKTFNVTGVFGDDVTSVSVMERDSVTLHTDVIDIQKYDVIRWRFQHHNTLLAEINKKAGVFSTHDDVDDGRFRDRLDLDQTGSLRIKNIRIKHSGLYTVDISSSRSHTIHKSFRLTVNDGVTVMSVMEGDSVTLNTNISEIQTYELIQWMFSDTQIAEMHKASNLFASYDGNNGIFKDRLTLNKQTGSLIISDITTDNTGQYDIKISSRRRSVHRRFILTVTAQSRSSAASSAVSGAVIFLLLLLVFAAIAGLFYYRRRLFKLKRQFGQKVAVVKGEAVNLYTDVNELQRDDVIQWRYKPHDTGLDNLTNSPQKAVIAKITDTDSNIHDDALDGKFRDRLTLNRQTGDLTVTDSRQTDAEVYKVKIISSGKKSSVRYNVNVCDEVTTVNQGDSVTLHTNVTDIQGNDQIFWRFGDSLIAQIDPALSVTSTCDGENHMRLRLNYQTGDLTITNIRLIHSGLYTLKIISGGQTVYKMIYVFVIDPNENRRKDSADIPLLNTADHQE